MFYIMVIIIKQNKKHYKPINSLDYDDLLLDKFITKLYNKNKQKYNHLNNRHYIISKLYII